MESALTHLEHLSYPEIQAWLGHALNGRGSPPLAIPDEPLQDAIYRHVSLLSRVTLNGICEGCITLLHRYCQAPEVVDDAYVLALLGLIAHLDLRSVALELGQLVDGPRFATLPAVQRRRIVGMLVDFRVQRPFAFWESLARNYPHDLGVLAFTALLRDGAKAMEILPLLPDDLEIADWIFFLLEKQGEQESVHLSALQLAAVHIRVAMGPNLREALDEWLMKYPPAAATRPVPSARSPSAEPVATKTSLSSALDRMRTRSPLPPPRSMPASIGASC
jgi:hypothetical protein